MAGVPAGLLARLALGKAHPLPSLPCSLCVVGLLEISAKPAQHTGLIVVPLAWEPRTARPPDISLISRGDILGDTQWFGNTDALQLIMEFHPAKPVIS